MIREFLRGCLHAAVYLLLTAGFGYWLLQPVAELGADISAVVP